MQRLARFLNIEVKDVIDIIEIDLKEDSIVIEGEENFKAVESLTKQKNNDDI